MWLAPVPIGGSADPMGFSKAHEFGGMKRFGGGAANPGVSSTSTSLKRDTPFRSNRCVCRSYVAFPLLEAGEIPMSPVGQDSNITDSARRESWEFRDRAILNGIPPVSVSQKSVVKVQSIATCSATATPVKMAPDNTAVGSRLAWDRQVGRAGLPFPDIARRLEMNGMSQYRKSWLRSTASISSTLGSTRVR
jgi:hypothetical protein